MTAVGDARKREAEKTQQAVSEAQRIAQEPASPSVAPGSTDDANGAQIADLTEDAWARGAHVIGDKVIALAKNRALIAHANGRVVEQRNWLDLIHALEADLALIDRREVTPDA